VSFKVSKGRFLGNIDELKIKDFGKYNMAFEDEFDSVDYLSSDDLFETENDALRKLVKVLNEVLKGK
jgi:hypothetical protein